MPKAKTEKAPPGPDDLVRAAAGEYTSGDNRFTVRSSDSNWYLVDNEQANEFGQELIHGPFATLAKARDAISGARVVKPLLRSLARPKKPVAATAPAKPKAPPKPPSWLDKLPAAEATDARRLIRALEKEGVKDAENVVRMDRDSFVPAVARALLEQRLRELVEAMPAAERVVAEDIVHRLAQLLTEEGVRVRRPLPGWELIEADGTGRAKPRRITLS